MRADFHRTSIKVSACLDQVRPELHPCRLKIVTNRLGHTFFFFCRQFQHPLLCLPQNTIANSAGGDTIFLQPSMIQQEESSMNEILLQVVIGGWREESWKTMSRQHSKLLWGTTSLGGPPLVSR